VTLRRRCSSTAVQAGPLQRRNCAFAMDCQVSRRSNDMIMEAVTYRRATVGFASGFVDAAPVKLHWNPFMYTTTWLVHLFLS
jgi:hypothetical protein